MTKKETIKLINTTIKQSSKKKAIHNFSYDEKSKLPFLITKKCVIVISI